MRDETLRKIKITTFVGFLIFALIGGALRAFWTTSPVREARSRVYTKLAVWDWERGEGRETEPWLHRALTAWPQNMEARRKIAEWYGEHGRRREALEEWRKLTRQDPDDVEAWGNLAHLYHREKSWEEAKKCYEKVLELPMTNGVEGYQTAHAGLARIAREKSGWDTAARQAQQAIDLGLDEAGTWETLGMAQEKLGKIDDAIASYRNTINADPNYLRAYSSLATLYAHRGQWDQAEGIYKQALEIRENDQAACLGLAQLYLHRKQPDEAQKYLGRALRRTPEAGGVDASTDAKVNRPETSLP